MENCHWNLARLDLATYGDKQQLAIAARIDGADSTIRAQTLVDVFVGTGPSAGQPLPNGDDGDDGTGTPPLFPMCGFGSLLAMMGSLLGLAGMKVAWVRRRRDG